MLKIILIQWYNTFSSVGWITLPRLSKGCPFSLSLQIHLTGGAPESIPTCSVCLLFYCCLDDEAPGIRECRWQHSSPTLISLYAFASQALRQSNLSTNIKPFGKAAWTHRGTALRCDNLFHPQIPRKELLERSSVVSTCVHTHLSTCTCMHMCAHTHKLIVELIN